MSSIDHTMEARRNIRDQDNKLAVTASLALETVRPLVVLQTEFLRLWALSCETNARNIEKMFDAAFSSSVEMTQQPPQQQG